MEDRTQFTLFWIDCEVLLCTGIMPVHYGQRLAMPNLVVPMQLSSQHIVNSCQTILTFGTLKSYLYPCQFVWGALWQIS